MSNGPSISDDSISTNPFLSSKDDEAEDDVSQATNEGDFLSKLNVKNVFNRLSTKSNEPKKVKSKVWNHVVNVVLIEGHDLLPKADNTLPDPFVKFRMGTERYKSKSKTKTLAPKWTEQFSLYMFDDQSSVLEISVRDTEIGGRETVLGSMTIDLENLEKEKTHRVDGNLDDDAGTISFLVTVCSMAGDPAPVDHPPPPNGDPQSPASSSPPPPPPQQKQSVNRKAVADSYVSLTNEERIFQEVGLHSRPPLFTDNPPGERIYRPS